MLEARVHELLKKLEPLGAADVPVAALMDLSEEPRLYERPAKSTKEHIDSNAQLHSEQVTE